jgi:hypothetical protein
LDGLIGSATRATDRLKRELGRALSSSKRAASGTVQDVTASSRKAAAAIREAAETARDRTDEVARRKP